MKKSVVALVVMSLMVVGCNSPKKDRADFPKREKKQGCGCQSPENILDLRGEAEKPSDGLSSPTVKF